MLACLVDTDRIGIEAVDGGTGNGDGDAGTDADTDVDAGEDDGDSGSCGCSAPDAGSTTTLIELLIYIAKY